MNFPGIDWKSKTIKHGTQYKLLHENFIAFLYENNLKQIIHVPTHIGGNTLDLVCTSASPNLTSEMICPGLSDHFIIDIVVQHYKPQLPNASYERRMYHRADVNTFQQLLMPTQLQLANINDFGDMWSLFNKQLKKAVEKSVPIKIVRPRPHNQP